MKRVVFGKDESLIHFDRVSSNILDDHIVVASTERRDATYHLLRKYGNRKIYWVSNFGQFHEEFKTIKSALKYANGLGWTVKIIEKSDLNQ